MSLTQVAASTWGATLNKAKQVYNAVVQPAMTFGASVWHSPKQVRKRGTAQVAKLTVLQNKCLRSITGAYRATNTAVLEAESRMMPLDIYLDQAVLRGREVPRCGEVIELAKAKIQKKLPGKIGEKRQLRATPISIKTHGPVILSRKRPESGTQGSRRAIHDRHMAKTSRTGQNTDPWEQYLDTCPSLQRTDRSARSRSFSEISSISSLRKSREVP